MEHHQVSTGWCLCPPRRHMCGSEATTPPKIVPTTSNKNKKTPKIFKSQLDMDMLGFSLGTQLFLNSEGHRPWEPCTNPNPNMVWWDPNFWWEHPGHQHTNPGPRACEEISKGQAEQKL